MTKFIVSNEVIAASLKKAKITILEDCKYLLEFTGKDLGLSQIEKTSIVITIEDWSLVLHTREVIEEKRVKPLLSKICSKINRAYISSWNQDSNSKTSFIDIDNIRLINEEGIIRGFFTDNTIYKGSEYFNFTKRQSVKIIDAVEKNQYRIFE